MGWLGNLWAGPLDWHIGWRDLKYIGALRASESPNPKPLFFGESKSLDANGEGARGISQTMYSFFRTLRSVVSIHRGLIYLSLGYSPHVQIRCAL